MKRLSERMADDGDMECHVFVDDVAELEAEVERLRGLAAEYDVALEAIRWFAGKDVEAKVDEAISDHLNGRDWRSR